jgi:hypothetical protein
MFIGHHSPTIITLSLCLEKLHNSQSKTVHDIAAARVRDARWSPVKNVQISLEDLQ